MNGALYALAFGPTKLARPVERGALLYQQPRAVAHPIAPMNFQFLESFGRFIPLMGRQLQWEFLAFPPILLQLPPPYADGRDDGSVVRDMVSWPPEPHVPKPLDVPFTCKNIIWLLVVHPPFPLMPPGPPCPGRLFVWSTGCEFP